MSRGLTSLFVLVACIARSISQEPSVNLPQGRIIGTKVYTEKSLVPVEIYYGIPYATPPIGRYRFSAPERHNGWRRTLQAHRMPPHCPHVDDTRSDTNYNEDCLFLNIWTQRQVDGIPLPVIIVLYSESWIRGGINLPCQDLAAEGVVVVTVAYRLHLLGFFNLGSNAARGNLALLDQYLAFLWVRENIGAFGGDPNSITLLGHSAGADSILHHLSSRRTNGLFQRAIIMSPRDIWKLLDDEKALDANTLERISREIALFLGCNGKDSQEILLCMRTRSIADILSTYTNANWSKFMQPVPESYLPESEQYLPTSLLSTISNNKLSTMQVDLLFGNTDLEAFNYNDETIEELMQRNATYVSEYINSKSIPALLKMLDLQVSELLIRATRWEYWNDRFRRGDDLLGAIELVSRIETSARWGAAGALLAARLARRVSRLYVYRYSQPASVDLYGRQFNFSGAIHGSDLISLLGDAFMLQVARRPATVNEKKFSTIFQTYIINFVKYGSPDNEKTWHRYKTGDANIFNIRADGDGHGSSGNKDVKFWLQYLPELSKLIQDPEQTGQLTSQVPGTSCRVDSGVSSQEFLAPVPPPANDNRLRGGVFAMCGVVTVLLLLLCASVILLHRQRTRRRFSISDEMQNR